MYFNSPQWGDCSLSSHLAGIISVMSVMALLFTWGSSLWRGENQKGTSNNWSSQKKMEVTQGQTFLLHPTSHSLLPRCRAHRAASGSSCIFRPSSSSSPEPTSQKCQCLAARTMHRYRCAEPLPFLKGIKKRKRREKEQANVLPASDAQESLTSSHSPHPAFRERCPSSVVYHICILQPLQEREEISMGKEVERKGKPVAGAKLLSSAGCSLLLGRSLPLAALRTQGWEGLVSVWV